MGDRTSLGVNVGPDARLPWPLGPLLGRLQQRSAFKSPHPPRKLIYGSEESGVLHEVSRSVPGDRPFYGWARRRPDGLWDTFRMGHRWDANWGDANVQGYNPDPHIVGGYFFDIILKRGQRVPHVYLDGGEAASTPNTAEGRPWWYGLALAVARRVGAAT